MKERKIKKLSKIPNINLSIKNIIKNSDIILYGPGTMHSSLFPTYLTKNLSSYISKSKAIKINFQYRQG